MREVRVWTVFLWTVVRTSENRDQGRHVEKLAGPSFRICRVSEICVLSRGKQTAQTVGAAFYRRFSSKYMSCRKGRIG